MIGKKLILALFMAAACSSEQHLPTPDASLAEGGETAQATGELTTSVGTDASKNIGAETAEALPGAFGYKCADKNGQPQNAVCNSNYCILDTNHVFICTILCVSGCPGDFICKQASGSDAADICLPTCVKEVEVCDGVDNDCNLQIDEGTCDDGNACTLDSCTEKQCKHQKLTGTPCSDGNACTQKDECVVGKCEGGDPMKCVDGNACTTDNKCTAIDGCIFPPQPGPCEDGNPCTVEDSCKQGTCMAGKPRVCEDSNPCTIDGTCDPKLLPTGCYFKNVVDGPAPINTKDGPNGSTTKDGCAPSLPWCLNGQCKKK